MDFTRRIDAAVQFTAAGWQRQGRHLGGHTVSYVEEAEVVAWHRRPRHGVATPIPDAEEFPKLLARLAEAVSTAAANISTGQAGLVLRPVSTIVLEPDQKALLHQVHDVSDWVFTIDKSLGIEFFDHHPASKRPEYLIDHSPDITGNSGRRVVITSRSQTEIRVLFERVLQDYDLGAYQNRSHALLGELRALSGRLALKLASSPTHRAEALGLALSRLYLEYHDVFHDQAVVPLDAHLDLFRALQKNADELEDEITLRRTDLALFDFDPSGPVPVLTCSLVEVKCYQAAGALGGMSQLTKSIAEQIHQSERALQHHFDPDRSGAVDRPDRIIKTQELINLLEFYLDRAHRLNFLSPEAYQEAKFFLRIMERGYKLRFTRSALVFDFDKDGTEEFVEENGIEFHRIGANLIRTLLEALPAISPDLETRPVPVPEQPGGQPPPETSTMQLLAREMPKLGRAAFIREERPRTVSWEKLSSSSEESESSETMTPERTPVFPTNPRMEPPTKGVQAPGPSVDPTVQPKPATQPQVPKPAPLPPEPQPEAAHPGATADVKPAHDVLLGVTCESPQFGVLGKVKGRCVALDLNQTHTISLFGVQGGGKSYTLGSIIEMASLALPGINCLPQPSSSGGARTPVFAAYCDGTGVLALEEHLLEVMDGQRSRAIELFQSQKRKGCFPHTEELSNLFPPESQVRVSRELKNAVADFSDAIARNSKRAWGQALVKRGKETDWNKLGVFIGGGGSAVRQVREGLHQGMQNDFLRLEVRKLPAPDPEDMERVPGLPLDEFHRIAVAYGLTVADHFEGGLIWPKDIKPMRTDPTGSIPAPKYADRFISKEMV